MNNFNMSGAVILLWLCTACSQDGAAPEAVQETPVAAPAAEAVAVVADEREQEAVSFGGQPLYRAPVDAAREAELDGLIEAIEQKGNLTEDDYITLGQYYIAGNRFRGAIDVYTKGLEAFPESFKLRRHRGHRYINVRELDKAIVDLNEAVELMGDSSSDVLEYDASGKPTASYEHWVWYHVGLYHYLNEDWEEAARGYEKCVATAYDNKTLVGATDWLYNAYQKGGHADKAAAAIDAISPDIDTDRNHPYFHRVMLYKGETTPDALLDIDKPGEEWTGRDITVGYGVANWYRFNGDSETAEKIHRKILQTPYWSSWAYVVTDKEYAQ